MAKFIIQGGVPLKGAVRLGGAKNASFKIMIASLLAKGESRLLNFSKISDVKVTKKIIKALGARVRECGERTVFINASRLISATVPEKLALASRASTMFIGPLLSRLKRAVVPLPGGDKIGKRPLDRHFEGLKTLGAKVTFKNGVFEVVCPKLKGAYYKFAKKTHTGTETLIMAAVLAQGETILENASLEPEIDDLINFLNKMGAKIKRKGESIEIIGVESLKPAIYLIMPDRNEAVSYAIAAVTTRGDIIVENAIPSHLETFLEKLSQAGGGFEIGNYGIRFFYKERLRVTDVITSPHPGFMTDWQPLWVVLCTQAKGTSSIIETVFPYRFQYCQALEKMGAKFSFFQPTPEDSESFYNFNLKEGENLPHGVYIKGPTRLSAIKSEVPDLRAGATLVLAALVAKGRTTLSNIEHIERGYENFDGRLRQLGAKIKRI